MSKEEIKVVPKVFDTYITMVENSIDSKSWQTIWADVDEVKTDVTQGGIKSCAFFVSSILKNFDFIKKTHATVASTKKDLKESGWVNIAKPKEMIEKSGQMGVPVTEIKGEIIVGWDKPKFEALFAK